MKNYTDLAMQVSEGYFGYYLIGVMESCHKHNLDCPDPEESAREYLRRCAPEVLESGEVQKGSVRVVSPSMM